MRARLYLDDRGHAVLLDARDDPWEAITRGLRDYRPLFGPPPPLSLKPTQLREADQTLPADGPADADLSGGRPAAQRVGGDAEQLGRLPDPHCVTIPRFAVPVCHKCLGILTGEPALGRFGVSCRVAALAIGG